MGRPGEQAPGAGTDLEGEAERAGAGDPEEDAAQLSPDHLRHLFALLRATLAIQPDAFRALVQQILTRKLIHSRYLAMKVQVTWQG